MKMSYHLVTVIRRRKKKKNSFWTGRNLRFSERQPSAATDWQWGEGDMTEDRLTNSVQFSFFPQFFQSDIPGNILDLHLTFGPFH